ncbi:LacI family DNA-binding transcriptional regulator [Salipaludibacillus sp. HK11]|uniref:LacI family DNA-binding transcriptional regulator n=1 Tax=Salipaludibacillus sp. HK11 TaxID=3394320 RepID=UPI0039FD0C24
MRLTIKQIAELAGVSRGTVSKIINNYTDVGEDTRRKVTKIMEENNYRPSYSAKTLASKKTNVIGVIYAGEVNADFNHPFFVDVIDSFKKVIGGMGYDLMFFSNENFMKESEDYLARCQHYNVDGCLIIGGGNIQPSVYDLDKSIIPCIGLDIELSGDTSAHVTSDTYQFTNDVIEHFCELGHNEIAHISGGFSSQISRIRIDYFREAMKRFQLPLQDNWILEGDFFENSGYSCMLQLLESDHVPHAIFTSSDLMAFGAIKAIKKSNYPLEDFAIVGLDDIHAAKYFSPPITTVRQNKRGLGEEAAYALSKLMNGLQLEKKIIIDAQLIVRESSNKSKIST